MELVIAPGGEVRCLYGEDLNLSALGQVQIRRASHVEPDEDGRWWADLAPVTGPRLGPFPCRSQALAAESNWLTCHWLSAPNNPCPAKEESCAQSCSSSSFT